MYKGKLKTVLGTALGVLSGIGIGSIISWLRIINEKIKLKWINLNNTLKG